MHGRDDALHHHHANAHEHGPDGGHEHGGTGHNHGPGRPVQWQTPHLDDAHDHATANDDARDLDLVEIAFIEGFQAASDPTSFLRLAGVPFEARLADGRRLTLLRVEQQRATDVGSVTPHLGGGSFHYAPLPVRLASRRDALSFMYFDGGAVVGLTLVEARELENAPVEAAGHEASHA
jgi:hypothetical protein